MPFAAVNGQHILYTDTDVGAGQPVLVFPHGLLMGHSMFAPQGEALKASRRCIDGDERRPWANGHSWGVRAVWL